MRAKLVSYVQVLQMRVVRVKCLPSLSTFALESGAQLQDSVFAAYSQRNKESTRPAIVARFGLNMRW